MNRGCSYDGCEGRHWRLGYCRKHFQNHRRSQYVELPCAACGKMVTRFKRRKPGQQVACSTRCREWCRSGSFPHYAGRFSIDPRDRQKLYERDNWTCQLCFTPTSRKFDWDDPLSPSLDHIVPKSRGGTNEHHNLRLAHWICNARRSDKEDVHVLEPPILEGAS